MEKLISSLLNIKDQLEQSLQRFDVIQQHLNDLRDSHNKMHEVFQQHMNEFEQGFVNLENQIYALQEEEKCATTLEEKEVVNPDQIPLSLVSINPVRHRRPFSPFSDLSLRILCIALPLRNYFTLSSFLSVFPSNHYSLIEIKQGLAIRWEFDPGGMKKRLSSLIGKHISHVTIFSFCQNSCAHTLESNFKIYEVLYTLFVSCGEGEWRTCMGLQVLEDTNLAPQQLDFLPLKVIFKPFDRGREHISDLRPYFQMATQSCVVKNWDANTGEVRNKLRDLMCDLGPSFIKAGQVAFNLMEEELDQPLETMSLKHNNMARAELIFPLICELDIRAYHKLSDAAIHSTTNSRPRLDSIDRFKCSCISDETLLEIPLACTNFHFTNASYCSNISLGIVRLPILIVSELHSWEDITSTLMAAIFQSYMWEVLSDKGVVELALGCGKSLKSLGVAACAKIADIPLETMGSHCKSLETLSLDSEYMSNKGLLVVTKGYNIRTMGLGYSATPIDGVIIVKREVAVGIKKILVFDPGGGTIVGKISHLVDKVLLWGMVCHTSAIEIGRTKVIAGLG